MKNKVTLATALLAAGFGFATIGVATANAEEDVTSLAEFQAMNLAKVSIVEAAAAVSAQSGARVIDISLSDENGVVAYQVTAVTADGTVLDFLVDPATGEVTQLTAENEVEDGDGDGHGESENGNESEAG